MIELRPEGKKDNAFIETVYYSTREAELNLTNWTEQQKNAFVLMQCMAQLSEYKIKFPGALFQVIVLINEMQGDYIRGKLIMRYVLLILLYCRNSGAGLSELRF